MSGRPSPWQLLQANRLAAGGLVILGAITALAIIAPLLPLAAPEATAPANRPASGFSVCIKP